MHETRHSMGTKKKQQPDTLLQEPVHFRPMQEFDLPLVGMLENQSQPYPWPRWFFRKQLRSGAACWVVEQQDEILGFGIMVMVKHWAHIMNMCVAPEYRRRGLGRRIMLHLLTMARQKHATHAWLEVRPTNRPAVLLYRKLGFRLKQIRKGYYLSRRGRQNALVMVRKL